MSTTHLALPLTWIAGAGQTVPVGWFCFFSCWFLHYCCQWSCTEIFPKRRCWLVLCPEGLCSMQLHLKPSALLVPSHSGFAGFRRRGEKDKGNFLYIVSAENVNVSRGMKTGLAALPLPAIWKLSARGESQLKSVVTREIAISISSLYFWVEKYLYATADLFAASADVTERLEKEVQEQKRQTIACRAMTSRAVVLLMELGELKLTSKAGFSSGAMSFLKPTYSVRKKR